MKPFILLLIFILSFNTSYTQIPNWQWAKKIGKNSIGYSKGVSSDNSGHVYVCGGFTGDLIVGNDTLYNNSGYDAYIAKYDENGNFIWIKRSVGKGEDFYAAITTDKNGYIYTAGYFTSDTLLVETHIVPNHDTQNSTKDIFITKYDSLGNVIWIRAFGGNLSEELTSIFLDNYGYIYFGGNFSSSSITFDITTLTNFSYSSMLFAKFDINGNEIWVRREGGGFDSQVSGIASDSNGNVFITGAFTDPVIIFGGTESVSGTCNTTWCSRYFIAKYNLVGNCLWAKGSTGCGTGPVGGQAICMDKLDNIIVTGHFFSCYISLNGVDTIFNSDPSSNYQGDVFVAKYSTTGNLIWANGFGNSGDDQGKAVAVDKNNEIYVTGMADANSFKFGTTIITDRFWGGFVSKFTAYGNVMWAKGIYGKGDGVCLDSIRNVYVTGYFGSINAVFNNDTLENYGGFNPYLAKLDSSQSGIITNIKTNKNYNNAISIYPNPFSFSTEIHFNIEVKNVTITIMNALGEEVRKMNDINGINVVIHKDDLKPGIYFIFSEFSNERIFDKIIIE